MGDTKSLRESGYRKDGIWKVLIHGFLQHKDAFFPRAVKEGKQKHSISHFLKIISFYILLPNLSNAAYMKRMVTHPKAQRYNILVVDWGNKNCSSISSRVSELLSYNNYADCTTNVALEVARMLVFLHKNNAINNTGSVHIVGFSLGAHVAGQAGRNVTDLTGDKIGRITGASRRKV